MAAGRRYVVQVGSKGQAEFPAKQCSKFEFITSTPSHDAVSLAKTKTLVRKHVMRDIGFARRRPHKRGDFTDDLPCQPAIQDLPEDHTLSEENNETIQPPISAQLTRYQNPNPTTVLGAGRVDPFNAFPIPIDPDASELVDHVWDDRNNNLQPFRDWWFALGFDDPGAMHHILANSALHLCGLRGELGDDSRSIIYYTRGIKSVAQRLSDPSQNSTHGILGAILGAMCHDHIAFRVDRWRIHLAGFEKIVNLRGGVQTIADNKPLAMALFWIEHNACTEMDLVPSFPPPYQYLPSLQSVPGAEPLSVESVEQMVGLNDLPSTPTTIDIINDLHALIALLKFELPKRNVWKDANFVGMWFYPILHKLLVLNCDPETSLEERNLEILRLGSILFIGEIRRLSGVFPVITKHLEEKLRILFLEIDGGDHGLTPVQTWALIMAGIRASGENERRWIVELLRAKYTDWNFVMQAISSLWWVDEVFLGSCKDLERDYESPSP